MLIGARVAGSTSYSGNSALFRQTTNAQGGPTFEFVEETYSDLDINTPSACSQLQMHDLSGDGKLDIICLDYSRLTDVWETSDTPPYLRSLRAEIGEELFQRWPYDMAVGDFNGDGRNDVFITSRSNYATLAAQVDERTVLARIPDQPETGFSFLANGDVTFEFGAYTQPPQIFIGATAWSPPWSADIGVGLDGAGANRVILTLSADDEENFGIASDQSERGAYIGFVDGRWQVLLNLRGVLEPTVSAKAGSMISGSITDLRSEPAGAVPLEQGPLTTGTRLYLGNANGQFVDWGTQSGLTQYPGSCVTVVAGDFDNDMDLDAYVGCTGNVGNLENVLFDNQGDGTFTLVADAGGAKGDYVGMQPRLENLGRVDALMTLDYDRDGCLDLFVTNGLYPRPFSASGVNRLYRNECSGNNNNWAEIKLVGVESNRDGIGAVVYATTPDGKRQMREQGGGTHHHSQNDTMLHIGLAQNPWVDIRVVWPDGQEDFYDALAINRVHTLTQGGGTGVPDPDPVIQCGEPAIDSATDAGIFLWNDCGDPQQWHARMTAGGGALIAFQGSVNSDQPFDSLQGFSLEASDSLPADFNTPTGGPVTINYTLNVRNTFTDGFEFHFPAGANACFDPASPALPVWVGASRVVASGPVNLTNFGEACLPPEVPTTPQCGAPVIDTASAADAGIFLWNDCGDPQQWHALMTAGGGALIAFQGSVTSDQLFDSLQGVSLEASDSLPADFNTPTAGPIAYTLNVRNTLTDGFDFHFPAAATNTCFDPASPALPMWIGSNRIEASGPVNLTTFGACTP